MIEENKLKDLSSELLEEEKIRAKAEAQLEEIRQAVLKYDKEANHIHAWRDFMFEIHKVLHIAWSS